MAAASGQPEIAVQDGVALAPCNAEWTSVFFLFQGYWIEIDPSGYLFDVSENGDGSLCHVALISNEFDFFLFGLPLFQNYYVTHDMEYHSMGWIPVEGSGKKPLPEGQIPVTVMEASADDPHWLVTLLVVLILIAVLGGVVVYSLLEASTYTTDDGEYWAWWICYSCCCCCCVLLTWIGVALIYVSTIPVDENYTPNDAQADGAAGHKDKESGHYADGH